METLKRWPSLSDQVELASELFGSPIGEHEVADWLAEQMSLVEDVDFAQEFAAHVQLPGVDDQDYAHQHIRTTQGELVEGFGFTHATPLAASSTSAPMASMTSTPSPIAFSTNARRSTPTIAACEPRSDCWLIDL